MIHFVTTRRHAYTVRRLVAELGRARCRGWSYETLFRRRSLPGGAWIFTDHERLSAFELSLAARAATLLQREGARVLNHPARVRGRHELLRLLKEAGVNCFSAWRAETFPRPNSFPVFIRSEFDHNSSLLELIHDQRALDATLAEMERGGTPLSGRLVIEYAGEEVSPGVWQRFATYRAGDQILAHHNVVDFKWVTKDVRDKARLLAHPSYRTFIDREHDFVLNNRHDSVLRRAFELARIDYGRADFALVGGIPQIYEINTNPNHVSRAKLARETHPDRRDIQLFADERLREAILALDRPAGRPIIMDDPALRRQQSFRARFLGLMRP